MKPIYAAIAVLLAFGATLANASSDDAWEEFRKTLTQKCRIAAGAGADSLVQIDPFGTHSNGVAIIYSAKGRRVCVMNKQTTALEISEPF